MKIDITTQDNFDELLESGIKDFSDYIFTGVDLKCRHTKLSRLPDLPNCIFLDCCYNLITELPELPNCTHLFCINNFLTSLPDLPNCVYLYCSDNILTSLPELPECKRCDCSYNKLTELPFTPKIQYINCEHNKISEFPELPSCHYLYAKDNNMSGVNYMISPTSERSVYYDKKNDRVLTGCFYGSLKQFYQKGYITEGKEWVKEFYGLNI